MKFSIFLILVSTLVFADVSQEAEKNELFTWELRTAPLALLASWYTVDISYRISEKVSTGPAIVVYGASEQGNMFFPSYKGNAVGWQANYYFDSVLRNSFYLGSRLYFENYNSYPHAFNGFNQIIGSRLNTIFGYKIKNSGILSMFGVGLEYSDHAITKHEDSQLNVDSHEAKLAPVLEVRMGIEI